MGFGKKNRVDLNPLHYNIGLLGEGGIGKTTLFKEVCETLAPEVNGASGYLHLDIGKEDGSEALEGLNSEKVRNWAKFAAVVDDIVKNKYTDPDYANLQTVIVDTWDELIKITEPEVIRLHNKENPDKPKITSIKQAYGGFSGGPDKVTELILDKLWELKEVDVHFMTIIHTKSKEVDDPVTGASYSILTSDTTQRYFNALKNKLHFLGVAYVDRTIVKEKTGKKDIMTKKDIERSIVTDEKRVIKFRDNNYSVDAKSRFAEITDSVPFDKDEFIKAIQDAILAESAKGNRTEEENKKLQKEADAKKTEQAKSYAKSKVEAEDYAEKSNEYIAYIKDNFTKCTAATKAEVKATMAEYNFEKFTDDNIPLEALEKITNIISASLKG